MPRNPYRYVGGPALTYVDGLDGDRLWHPALAPRLDELERFAARAAGEAERGLAEAEQALAKAGRTPAKAGRALAAEDAWRRQKEAAERTRRLAGAVRLLAARGDADAAAHAALDLGLAADGLALLLEFGRDLAAGQGRRRGGHKGAEFAGHDPELHARWLALDRELSPAEPSQRARAKAIATGPAPRRTR